MDSRVSSCAGMAAAILLAVSMLVVAPALAQRYPNKPVT